MLGIIAASVGIAFYIALCLDVRRDDTFTPDTQGVVLIWLGISLVGNLIFAITSFIGRVL